MKKVNPLDLSRQLPGATHLASAPGRVNLLGEHVDYNAGVVLPVAIDRRVWLAARPSVDPLVSLHAMDLNQKTIFSLNDLGDKVSTDGKPLPSWALYPAGVAWSLQQYGLAPGGIQAVFSSDVPIGAGLSSSAALELAFAVLWQLLGAWQLDRLALAQICQAAENKYVGVNCGLMDQFASAHGVEDHALYFDTRNLEWHPLPLPANVSVVVADSGVRRELATSAYNERRAACEQAVKILQVIAPQIQSLRDVTPPMLAANQSRFPPEVYQRARHVVEEIARVDQATAFLEKGDARGFGLLMLQGHASLRDLYEVSCPELDALVNIASHLPGCFGARLTGAGFGGCTVNLVQTDLADRFAQELTAVYQHEMGGQAAVYVCKASRGAFAEWIKDS